jgi:hypothetical protein
MATQRRSVTKGRWTRSFIVAFLAIAAAVLLIAQPVVVNAAEQEIIVKEKDVTQMTVKITYDDWMRNVSATVDGKPLKVSTEQPYPIVLGKNSQKIVGIYGPVIVFEGNSRCFLIAGHWVGIPAGTVCP